MKIVTTAAAACAAALLQAPLLLALPTAATAAPLVERPIVISHRGASGYLPEETMASYHLAVAMGPISSPTSSSPPTACSSRATTAT